MDSSISVYEYNKQLLKNEVPMDALKFNKEVFGMAKAMTEKDYWMLLNRERNDYSIFITKNATEEKIKEELTPTLTNRGTVLLMQVQESGVYEIWIRDTVTQENFVYYLFDYENGIIDCREKGEKEWADI